MGISFFARRHFTDKGKLFLILILLDGERSDAGSARLVGVEFSENFLRARRLFREHELKVMSQRVFHGGDKIIRHTDAIRERANDAARLAQCRDRACIETLVRTFKLFEDVQARTLLRLLLQKLILLLRGRVQFGLQFFQPILPLLDGAARGGYVEFLHFYARGEFLQTRFETHAFFLKLNFLGRKFFKANQITLLCQIKRREFVANARQILRGAERGGLCLTQIFLLRTQALLDFA